MIGILFGILKWIGILLLAILGLLLAILLIVLLAPIRYRLKAARSPAEGAITASGKVSWLASILAVTFAYDRELSWKVRICGIPLKPDEKTVSSDADQDLTEAPVAPVPAHSEENDKPLTLQAQAIPSISDHSAKKDSFTEEVPQEGSAAGAIDAVKDRITGIPEKLRWVKQRADTWIRFIKSDEVKLLLSACRAQVKQILRHLLPTKLRIRGNYGFADPALTGQITGVIALLSERYPKAMDLHPHFNEECLDGEVTLEGRIRLGSLLFPIVKILIKPCTWNVYKSFRTIIQSGESEKQNKKKSNINEMDPHKGGK